MLKVDKEKLWPEQHQFAGHTFKPDELAGALDTLATWVNFTGHQKGFWDPQVDRSLSTKMMKIIGELGQGFEEYRRGDKPSDKIPSHTEFEEELSDAVILIFDLAKEMGFDLGAAIISKGLFNEGRPRLHGKQF
jgi:NTP pyrophosphatase (non-canonical NTP hydrolase)